MPKGISQFLPFEPVAKLHLLAVEAQGEGLPFPQNPFQVAPLEVAICQSHLESHPNKYEGTQELMVYNEKQ